MARRTIKAGRADDSALVADWRDISACYSSLRCDLDRELDDHHGLGMSEFEVLDRLVEAPAGECRMHTLGDAMYLSQSALSRVVARLEREGLLVRDMCADDRRSVRVRLTEAGADRHEKARPTQLAVLARHLREERQPAGDGPA
ncbi:MarR family winged helix-turn-helix transcriptional regulator [Rugosimonospora africana]|uniref:Transcriptional regulator n=1 Tax=Rugosimonospora africana TaxID=556532 RepID=A0A8J3QN90_9ACTN|nr:MarR family transcriptional regulator [Rugosimonospora africana]GIH13054.1 transcriptional regulator [Rugosimonospora africana]